MKKKLIIGGAILLGIGIVVAVLLLVARAQGKKKQMEVPEENKIVEQEAIVQPEGEITGDDLPYKLRYEGFDRNLLLIIEDKGENSWRAAFPEGAESAFSEPVSDEIGSLIAVIPAAGKTEVGTITCDTAEYQITITTDERTIVTEIKAEAKVFEAAAEEQEDFSEYIKYFHIPTLPKSVVMDHVIEADMEDTAEIKKAAIALLINGKEAELIVSARTLDEYVANHQETYVEEAEEQSEDNASEEAQAEETKTPENSLDVVTVGEKTVYKVESSDGYEYCSALGDGIFILYSSEVSEADLLPVIESLLGE